MEQQGTPRSWPAVGSSCARSYHRLPWNDADRGGRSLRAYPEQLVICVRCGVPDRERGVRGDLLFDLQRVRFHGGSLEIRLYAAGRNLRASGDGRSGNNVDARERDVFQGQDGVERTVLVKAITKI